MYTYRLKAAELYSHHVAFMLSRIFPKCVLAAIRLCASAALSQQNTCRQECRIFNSRGYNRW